MTLPLTPPTVAPTMLWPPCGQPVKKSGCGCGCNGAGGCGEARSFTDAVRDCPWWIWALAAGVVILAGGERQAASGAKRQRRRR